MFAQLRYGVLSLVFGGAMFAAGCASSVEKGGSASSVGGGMMCPTCQTVWTFDTVGQGTKMQRLEAKPGMTCPDCDAMAAAYIKDGEKVLHNCETCKVRPTVLKPAEAGTHPKGTHS
jgi:hypothetical protein